MNGRRIVLGMLVLVLAAGWSLRNTFSLSVPDTPFAATPLPSAPDYAIEDNWSALPWRNDSADWLPAGSGYSDAQHGAPADVFYVYPTAAFFGGGWVVAADDGLANLTVDYGIQPQQAAIFNGIARIFSPRYRSVRMSVWSAEDRDSMTKATALAYSDVKRAFEHYLEHWNHGRPIIVVSHSQGTLHTIRLLREVFDGKPLASQLVAAYLVGNTVADVPWFRHISLCRSAAQTGCYVTWNTLLEGGSSYHWIEEKGLRKIDCVNPLSWKDDTVAVDAAQNGGSLPMVDYRLLFHETGPLQLAVVGARCGDEGILWISRAPAQPGYESAVFDNGTGYHTYDFNLYYDSIRRNAALRVHSYLSAPH